MDRSTVYKALDSEREYQERQWDRTQSRPLSVAEELLLAEDYLAEARNHWRMETGHDRTLEFMRKVAGIMVRCFEHHGVPMRESNAPCAQCTLGQTHP